MSKYEELNRELSNSGLPKYVEMGEEGDPIDTLVNTKTSSKPYLSILLKYIPLLEGNEKEMVVRALSEKACSEAVPHLLEIMRRPDNYPELLLWAVGNALSIIDDKESYSEIIELCRDTRLGLARQMLLEILVKIKSEEVFSILVDGATDPSMQLHAIISLGKYGDQRGIMTLKQIDTQSNKQLEKAISKALNRLKK